MRIFSIFLVPWLLKTILKQNSVFTLWNLRWRKIVLPWVVWNRTARRAGFGVWQVCRLCTIRAGNSCFGMLMPKILRLCPTDRVILCGNGCVGSKYTWKCGSTWASIFLIDLVCGAIFNLCKKNINKNMQLLQCTL